MSNFLKGKVSYITQLYHKWRALKGIPYRNKIFIGKCFLFLANHFVSIINIDFFYCLGYDLEGNTFWEFRIGNNSPGRLRRIVEYRTKKNWADHKIAPQWAQWLRYARIDSPTLEELRGDLLRQQIVKQRAAQINKEWESVPLKFTEKGESGKNINVKVSKPLPLSDKGKTPKYLRVEESEDGPIQSSTVKPVKRN